ncbi:hypothetical protein A7K73_10150 [Candidatus Methylacidiphilum fumarolicum]|nr:hypothetical protein A7K73_10150 [Candidatus Methylacidiphilum fumarolicum]TFE75692.1 hypothetical protein A7D33_10805 [Candidatus Methylacidiphilum fumarolicum]
MAKTDGLSTIQTETDWTTARFLALADRWSEECRHLSSIRDMVLHPAYQQIIGMGPSMLLYILDELERHPDHWFWALRAITGGNSIRSDNQGRVREMTLDWLEWAVQRRLR